MHHHDASHSVHTLPFSTPRNAILTMLVYAIRWLSMHLYTLAYMFMQESCLLVCRLYFNTMKLWAFNPNIHLSLADTTFCLLFCLFAFTCTLVCFIPIAPYLCIFSFHCWFAGFLFLPLYVHTWSEDAWS